MGDSQMLVEPTRRTRRAFAEHGFVQLREALDAHEVGFWRAKFEAALRGVDIDRSRVMVSDRYWQYINGWYDDPEVKEHMLGLGIAGVVQRLLDVDCLKIWGLQFMVRPGYSSAGGFHVDMAGWPFIHPRAAVAWIALDDADVTNGCLWYLPGTHRSEAYENGFGRTAALAAVFEHHPAWRNVEAVPMPARTGDVLIHNALVAHAAGANMTPRSRRVLILSALPDSARPNRRPDRHRPDRDLDEELAGNDHYPIWSRR